MAQIYVYIYIYSSSEKSTRYISPTPGHIYTLCCFTALQQFIMEARLSARNVNVAISHSLTNPRSLATWEKLKARPGHGRPIKAGTVCHFWDKESPKYAWLPEGWLAEQRRMPSRRLYTVRKYITVSSWLFGLSLLGSFVFLLLKGPLLI